MLETKIEKVNYLKSIKEKEHKILNYYKKIHNKDSIKDKPIIKKRKRTKKNIGKDKLILNKDDKDEKEDNEENGKEPISIVAKQEKEKLTKKKQFVIMD
jgi:hypothetical protein